MTRRRADVVLAERGLFESRERAKAAILAGSVACDGRPLTKAGELVEVTAEFTVAQGPKYVSRGGVKLAGALAAFGFDPAGLAVVDVGASTGGFTDCVLQMGAASVTAVDVGYGQLAWQLRQDPRVRVFERTNIRTADPVALGAPFDLAVVDVSFVGLLKVLPNVLAMLADDSALIALVKPQFEAGKGRVGKRGVVRDAGVHREVLEGVVSGLNDAGLVLRGLTWSPITGPEGNIEFWVWVDREGPALDVDIQAVVTAAHEELGV